VSIQGPSGGGKSTLLNILGLLDSPTSGTFRIGEVDTIRLADTSVTRLRSDSFAFIFQSFHLLEQRPVTDSVELGLLYRGVTPALRATRVHKALAAVGIAHLAASPVHTLSGGERQRVAIARALASGTPVVLADEPTGNLDSAHTAEVVECLKTLHKTGTTVILVTHDPDVAAHAERHVTVVDGHVVSDIRDTRSSEARLLRPAPVAPGRASMLRVRDLWKDAWRSLLARRGRSYGLVLAVALGVALASATLGVSWSAQAQVSDTFDARVNRDVTLTWSNDIGDADGLTGRLLDLSGVEAVAIVSDYGGHTVQANAVRPRFTTRIMGAQGDLIAAGRLTVEWASPHSDAVGPQGILIGRQLATELGLGPVALRPSIYVGGDPRTVVGVITDSPRIPDLLTAVVVPNGAPDYANDSVITTALIRTVPGAAQNVASQAPLVVDPFAPMDIVVNAPVDPADLRLEVEQGVRTTLGIVTAIALLGAMASLMNAMILSVSQRQHEFGLRRAVGARARHLSNLVMVEATLLGLVGGIVGVVLAIVTLTAITIVNGWIPILDLRLIPAAVLAGIVVGGLGGIGASVKASRTQPHLALRS